MVVVASQTGAVTAASSLHRESRVQAPCQLRNVGEEAEGAAVKDEDRCGGQVREMSEGWSRRAARMRSAFWPCEAVKCAKNMQMMMMSFSGTAASS